MIARTATAVGAWTRRYVRRFGGRRTALSDVKAGVVLGIESVPDGLAAGFLAGLNPLAGLYGYLVGTLAGALTTGSMLMTVQATGAMAVVVSDVDRSLPDGLSTRGLAALCLLAGIIMLALGIARLGSVVRFIPTAVLVGFVNAVAVNIVLGQIDSAVGRESEGANRILRAGDAMIHLPQWNFSAVLVSALTVAVILLLERTRIGALAMVVAIIAGSAVAALLNALPGSASVQTIGELTAVPNTLPGMIVPDFSAMASLILPAASLALVGLVQGAAISGSVPNPDGRYADASADFRGQGIANIAVGLFQGMPVGGSMSATALVRAAGARTALANLVAAVVMALTVLACAGAIEHVAMPTLAGLLILIGVRTVKLHDVVLVWRTGPVQATVLVVTFVLTMLIPLQYAVLSGVAVAVLLFVIRQSNRIVVRRWIFDEPEGMPLETDAPAVLTAGDTVVLVPYGSLFFAAAPVFEARLPQVTGPVSGAVVIIRLRGKDEIGATFLKVIENYESRVREAGGLLLLAGVGENVIDQLRVTGVLARWGEGHVYPARPRVGDATSDALAAARSWRAGRVISDE